MLQNVVVATAAAIIKEDPDTFKEFFYAKLHTVSGLLFKHGNL